MYLAGQRANGDRDGASFCGFCTAQPRHKWTRAFKSGDVIFKTGDAGNEFFVVRAGKVAVRVGNRTLQVLEEGEIFGEMALADAEPRSATIIAEGDCVVVPVGEKQFLYMITEAPCSGPDAISGRNSPV